MGADFIDRLGRFDRRLAWILAVLVIIVYLPATECGFIWDDDDYVQYNSTIAALGGLRRIWFEIGSNPQYYPLVHSSFWLEYRLWGTNPTGYHVVNVLLHAGSAVLLYKLLARLRVPGAWFGAALFALHPVQVESVAWITERKNILSCLCYLLSAHLYFDWEGQGPAARGSRGRYVLALLAFACALFSKTVTASLPAALLVVAWWRRGRLSRSDVLPLVPFFLLGAGLGSVTVWVEHFQVGAAGALFDSSAAERLLVAGRAPWFYLSKLLLPVDLAFIYPRWNLDTGSLLQWLFPLAVVLTLILLFVLRGRIGRGPLAALLLFGGTLFPALGFIDVYPFLFSYVADHFQHHASIAPLALLGALAVLGTRRLPAARQPLAVLGGVVILGVLCVLTWRQQANYRDLETLWRDTLTKSPDAWIAHTNLGNVLRTTNRGAEAMRHYERAIEINPDLPEARYNLGNSLLFRGRYLEAIRHLERGLASLPEPTGTDADEGVSFMRQKLQAKLGAALRIVGRPDEALPHLLAALAAPPDTAMEHHNLALIYMGRGNNRRAADHLEQALRLNPDDIESKRALAWALATARNPELRSSGRGLALAEEAAREKPDAAVLHTLAVSLSVHGQHERALETAREALQAAQREGLEPLSRDIQRGLELYRAGKPYSLEH